MLSLTVLIDFVITFMNMKAESPLCNWSRRLDECYFTFSPIAKLLKISDKVVDSRVENKHLPAKIYSKGLPFKIAMNSRLIHIFENLPFTTNWMSLSDWLNHGLRTPYVLQKAWDKKWKLTDNLREQFKWTWHTVSGASKDFFRSL